MNSIMSGALPNHYPFRGALPTPYRRPSSANTPTSPQSPLDFIDRIPPEEIEVLNETLGSGSFGTVFKGRWRGKKVAVKQFKTREERDSFLVEVKQLSSVKHENIVVLYGATTTPDTACLIMEYAESGSLSNLLHECKNTEYDLRHACSWARQAARGVAYLHGIRPKPIMHRDLKPANLLLFRQGRTLKICDFGTACDVKTQMTNNTGSPSYMAPEVFSTSSYLESGDVFSWSIIFWEIMVRLHPYDQKFSNHYQILWSVMHGSRPDVIENCPRHIWNLITKCWNEDPNKRPTMQFVADEMNYIYKLVDRINQRHTPNAPQPQDGTGCCISKTHKSPSTLLPNDSTYALSQQPQTSNNRSMCMPDYLGDSCAATPRRGSQCTNADTIVSRDQSMPTIRERKKEAYNHRVVSLKEQSRKLEEGLKCDKKDTDRSLSEFENLKIRLKLAKQHLMMTIEQQHQQKQYSENLCPSGLEYPRNAAIQSGCTNQDMSDPR